MLLKAIDAEIFSSSHLSRKNTNRKFQDEKYKKPISSEALKFTFLGDMTPIQRYHLLLYSM